jgi:UDP-N-acetylglucosamine 2-epimerase
MEGVWAKTVKLVGTDREKIFQEIKELFENPGSYQAMAQARNPYGDGHAARRIVEIIAAASPPLARQISVRKGTAYEYLQIVPS